jgi:hypothetical protein
MNASGLRQCVNTIRADRAMAATFFADDRFDLIFLDAVQTYEGMKKEIAAWLPKLRRGGVLMGHDYENVHTAIPDVRRVVDELFGHRIRVVESLWVHRVE